jgi:transcriptional regulator with XRE-family HTH domain
LKLLKGGSILNSNEKKEYHVNLHRLYLKNRREELGRTVIDVGDLSGISSDYYCQIENGFRGKKLSVKMLLQIADALDMNLCEALEGEKEFIKESERMTKNIERVFSG